MGCSRWKRHESVKFASRQRWHHTDESVQWEPILSWHTETKYVLCWTFGRRTRYLHGTTLHIWSSHIEICDKGQIFFALQGDSGSGLFCGNSSIVTGVASFGTGCGRYPDVYTNVFAYDQWIRHVLKFPEYDVPPTPTTNRPHLSRSAAGAAVANNKRNSAGKEHTSAVMVVASIILTLTFTASKKNLHWSQQMCEYCSQQCKSSSLLPNSNALWK